MGYLEEVVGNDSVGGFIRGAVGGVARRVVGGSVGGVLLAQKFMVWV